MSPNSGRIWKAAELPLSTPKGRVAGKPLHVYVANDATKSKRCTTVVLGISAQLKGLKYRVGGLGR